MASSFFTIGHSTRPLDVFVDLLRQSSVDLVVDVRSMPRPRTNLQFNSDSLSAALAPWQIGYRHIAALEGLGGKQPLSEASLNAYWRVRSFRNYADYAFGRRRHPRDSTIVYPAAEARSQCRARRGPKCREN